MGSAGVLGWLAISSTILLEIATTIVFLYQRTLRTLSSELGANQRILVFLYPKRMLAAYQASFMKCPLYIYLLWISWPVAIAIFAVSFMISMLIPVANHRHLLTMRKRLKSLYKEYGQIAGQGLSVSTIRQFLESPLPYYMQNYETILIGIDNCLVESGYEMSKIEEYAMVSKYGILSDETLATLLTAEHGLFSDIRQAKIHIGQIRDRLGIHPECDQKLDGIANQVQEPNPADSPREIEQLDLFSSRMDLS